MLCHTIILYHTISYYVTSVLLSCCVKWCEVKLMRDLVCDFLLFSFVVTFSVLYCVGLHSALCCVAPCHSKRCSVSCNTLPVGLCVIIRQSMACNFAFRGTTVAYVLVNCTIAVSNSKSSVSGVVHNDKTTPNYRYTTFELHFSSCEQ